METVQQRLEEAEKAYHQLLTGQSVRVFVDQNGERIEYSVASRANLAAYIQMLKTSLGQVSTGPMRVWF